MKAKITLLFLVFSYFLIGFSNAWAAKTEFDEYIIGPGDVLEIIVWKEPDFSRDITVRPDGRITLPLIDDVMAAGKTPMQLKEEIQKKLEEYIDLPVVTVIVKGINSKFYYMIGEIKKPGVYPLSKPTTILQALSIAGGFTEWANKSKIKVLRFEKDKRKILIFNYEKAVKGKEINDFYLLPDDIILIP
ncbi:polysaccharide biosynthesis/export family protein [Thermodesulfatator indicus]